MSATNRKNTPRLRDGVMKRSATWSYVIRVKDPETGISKPRWVGGFATEEDAKAARDEARVKARHGEYIDRNRITVAAYLAPCGPSHSSGPSWPLRSSTGCSRSSTSRPIPEHAAASCSICDGRH